MSERWIPDNELMDLVEAVCHGEPSDEQTARLEARVLGDQHARQYYIRYLHMHAHLPLLQGEQPEDAVEGAGEVEDARTPAPPVPTAGMFGAAVDRIVTYFSDITPFSWLVATLITLSMLGVLAVWVAPVYWPQAGGPDLRVELPTHVAQIGRAVDCRWADPGTAPQPGFFLPQGRRLELVSGLVEIKFGSGANVFVQGPATFTVESEAYGRLGVGRLTAHVSKPARGFTIGTPTARIVDLGTEFGVEVGKDQDTQVHVLTGAVEVARTDAPDGARIRLGAGEGLRVDSTGMTRMAADADFVRSPPAEAGESHTYTAMALELRPAAYWNFETIAGDKRVLDVSGNGHDGQLRGGAAVAEGAGRVGNALWLDGTGFVEVPNHPALHPGRGSFTVAGWIQVLARTGEHHLLGQGSTATRYGEPRIAWSVRLDKAGRLRAGMDNAAPGSNTFATALTADLRDGRWYHVAVVFDRERPAQLYYVDGQLVHTESLAGKVVDRTLESPHTLNIGMNDGFGFTTGLIDEVLLFRRALSAEEIRKLCPGNP